jgi:hypothetical protein
MSIRLLPYLILAAASCALAAVAPPTGITSAITAPADEEPAFVLRGEGTHAFECRPLASDPNRFAWAFATPNVTLYDAGRPVARHAAENTWEATGDRSSVSGAPRARQDGGASNLPWLLFRTQSTQDTGLFAGVTSVQRVNTAGGVAPDSGCDASNAGKETRVAVAADYYFYRRR